MLVVRIRCARLVAKIALQWLLNLKFSKYNFTYTLIVSLKVMVEAVYLGSLVASHWTKYLQKAIKYPQIHYDNLCETAVCCLCIKSFVCRKLPNTHVLLMFHIQILQFLTNLHSLIEKYDFLKIITAFTCVNCHNVMQWAMSRWLHLYENECYNFHIENCQNALNSAFPVTSYTEQIKGIPIFYVRVFIFMFLIICGIDFTT